MLIKYVQDSLKEIKLKEFIPNFTVTVVTIFVE